QNRRLGYRPRAGGRRGRRGRGGDRDAGADRHRRGKLHRPVPQEDPRGLSSTRSGCTAGGGAELGPDGRRRVTASATRPTAAAAPKATMTPSRRAWPAVPATAAPPTP